MYFLGTRKLKTVGLPFALGWHRLRQIEHLEEELCWRCVSKRPEDQAEEADQSCRRYFADWMREGKLAESGCIVNVTKRCKWRNSPRNKPYMEEGSEITERRLPSGSIRQCSIKNTGPSIHFNEAFLRFDVALFAIVAARHVHSRLQRKRVKWHQLNL